MCDASAIIKKHGFFFSLLKFSNPHESSHLHIPPLDASNKTINNIISLIIIPLRIASSASVSLRRPFSINL